MTINYTTLLGLAKPVTGTETGDWGDVVNDEITTLLEDAVANAATFSVTSGNVTLTTTNGASNQARMSTLIITGTPGTTRNVIAPSQAKVYQVINQSDGAVVIKGSATTGVTIAAGATGTVVWNGSDFVEINSTSSGRIIRGNLQVTGNLQVDGNTQLGNATSDTLAVSALVNSNLLFTDNSFDIGASGATRPRSLFLGTNLTVGSLTSTRVPYASTGGLLVDSANMTFNGTRLTVADLADSGLTAGRVVYVGSGSALVDSANLTFDGTRLGIGTATPAGPLHIAALNSAGTQFLTLQTTDSTQGNAMIRWRGSAGTNQAFIGSYAGTADTGNLEFGNGNTTNMLLSSGGNLGVGTTSPNKRLHIQNGSSGASNYAVPGLAIESSSNVDLQMMGSTTGQLGITFSDSGNNQAGFIYYQNNGDFLQIATNGAERMRLNSSGQLLIGTTTGSTFKLDVQDAGNTVARIGGSGTGQAGITIASGGPFNPFINFLSSATTVEASIYAAAGSGALVFGTGSLGTERARITSGGSLLVGTTTERNRLTVAAPEADFPVLGTASGMAYLCNGTAQYGTMLGTSGFGYGWLQQQRVDGVATSYDFYLQPVGGRVIVGGGNTFSSAGSPVVCNTTANAFLANTTSASGTGFILFGGWSNAANLNTPGTMRFVVYDSGNVLNWNNSYGGISDVKLKENITDATPKLEKLNQVRVVNYNLIGDTHKQIGVIAQELEQIFPGMVEEVADKDAEGNDLGTTTKSVKYSVFVPMLIKAIQELKAEFDAYKATHP